MKKIASFTVDHLRLLKGVYVSRRDLLGQENVTTFDLRMKKPNSEKLENESIHTVEHLVATYLRNDTEFGNRIVYFGPMGCLTGMYLVVHGYLESKEILPLLINAFQFIVDFEGEIPGVSEKECGNYLLHSLEKAKSDAASYLEILRNATDLNLYYPAD